MKKSIFLLITFSIVFVEYTVAQNSFPTPTGVIRINEKTGINRLLFQEIVEPNGESLVSMITGQQRGLLVKDRVNSTGGLWLIGGASTSTPTSAGGIGAGFVGDMGTYLALAPNTSAITFLDGKINFFANKGFSIGQAYFPTPKMVLNADGNIGIGTTDPRAKLHIEGDTYVGTNPIKFLGASTGINKIQSFAGNVFGTWEFKSQFDNIIFDAGADGNNLRKIIFKIGGSDKMLIAENGNVGIGTTNPDSKLAVNGTIHSKEVRVDLSGWPDYVFEPTYNLKPLSELEAYIKENKHLPEVPAASEVEKNGVHLGEMNKLLMRKVEELTLYLIEKDKQFIELKEEIKELKKSNIKIKE